MRNKPTKRAWLALAAGLFVPAPLWAQMPASTDLRQEAKDILASALKDRDKGKRIQVVSVLAVMKNSEWAKEEAVKALKDSAPEVRAAGAITLGKLGARDSTAQLQTLLEDPSAFVVLAATNALRQLGDPSVYEVYSIILSQESLVRKRLSQDQVKKLRDPNHMAGLGFSVGMGFVPFGGLTMRALEMIRRDDVSPLRAAAAIALADDPNPESAETLLSAMADKSWVVRAAVLDALARRGQAVPLEKLRPALTDKNDLVRYQAAATILHLGDLASAASSK